MSRLEKATSKAIADTVEYMQFVLDESASKQAVVRESEILITDYVMVKYGRKFNDDELNEIISEANGEFGARF